MTTPATLRPGLKLHSSTCETELIVIRAAATPTALTCGGAAVGTEPVAVTDRQPVDPGAASGTLLGKRYVDAAGTLEVLCTRAGAGSLALDGVPLEIKAAKPLPASD